MGNKVRGSTVKGGHFTREREKTSMFGLNGGQLNRIQRGVPWPSSRFPSSHKIPQRWDPYIYVLVLACDFS